MFNSKQIDEIIKKLSRKAGMYEGLFINYVSKNILKTKCLTLNEITKLLRDSSLYGTKFIMSAATARAGGEQAGYGKIICEAIDRASANIQFENLINKKDVHNRVYSKFLEICREQSKKPNEKINKKLIIDFLTCAQNCNSNLFLWLEEHIKDSGVESTYLELLKIHGVGKKLASFILRDTVWLLNLEKAIPPQDLIYLQPIDTWVKRISFELWEDFHTFKWEVFKNKIDELIIAKRIVENCIRLGVSGIEFNQGAWYFGSNEVKDGNLLRKHMTNLISKVKLN